MYILHYFFSFRIRFVAVHVGGVASAYVPEQDGVNKIAYFVRRKKIILVSGVFRAKNYHRVLIVITSLFLRVLYVYIDIAVIFAFRTYQYGKF